MQEKYELARLVQTLLGLELVALKHGGAIELPDAEGCTLLWLAAEAGHAPIVEMLLEARAVVAAPNSSTGNTPLHIAAQWRRKAHETTLVAGLPGWGLTAHCH